VTDLDLSYWEALRAYWRLYWPTQLTVAATLLAAAVIRFRLAPLASAVVLGAAGTAALFLFVPRLYSRGYRGFSLVILGPDEAEARRLTLAQRATVWWFLWWRQLVAGVIAGFLAAPTNIVLGIMGLHVGQSVALFAGILIIGPILMKMLIGNPFDTFRIEVRRDAAAGAEASGGTV
jgi:hypothetical protein